MSEETKKPEYTAENESAEADTIFGAAPEVKPAPEKKGISANMKALIIALCLAAGVGIGLAAVSVARHLSDANAPAEATDTTAAENIPLNKVDVLNLTDVDIRGENTFHVKRTFRGRADAAGKYTIEGFEGLAMDENFLSTIVNNGCALEANRIAEEHVTQPEKYGLSPAKADVTLTYEDGTTYNFKVGDTSPTEAALTYCMVGDTVYLVRNSLVSNFCKAPDSFLSKTILEKPADESLYPIVDNLRIERKDLPYNIYLEYDTAAAEDTSVGGSAATHVMREPIFTYLNVDKSKDVTHGMFGLTAQEVPVIRPSEADLTRSGLDDPFCTVTMNTGDGESRVLKFGNTYEDAEGTTLYYTMLEGVNEIFGVKAEDAAWLTVQPGDISSSNIFVTNVWNIGTLEIKDKTHDLKFEGEGNKDNYTVTKNGAACDTERFRTLYRFLLYIYGEELYLGEMPEGEPDAEVHLTTQNGREDYTVSFYKVSDLRTVVVRDGQPSYVIRSSAVDTLSYNLDIFDDTSKEFKTTWQ